MMKKILSIVVFLATTVCSIAQRQMNVTLNNGATHSFDLNSIQKVRWSNDNTLAIDYMLQIDIASIQDKPWDSQIFVYLPRPLSVNKKYEIRMSVYGDLKAMEDLGSFVDDDDSANRDEWGNSTDLQYTWSFKVTDSWREISLGQTNGNYPYNRFVLQLGKCSGTLYIDDLKFIEEGTGNTIHVNFNSSLNGVVSKPNWHSHVSYRQERK